jgi:hypothetical protein
MIGKLTSLVLAASLLAACGGNPFVARIGEDDPATPPPPTPGAGASAVPETLALNLRAATYNADAGTLVLQLASLDSGSLTATYVRTPLLDHPGYEAYTVQNDPLDRHVTAMVARSGDPQRSVQAGVASDGGQFNTFFSGGFFERMAPFTRPDPLPDGGLVSYAGNYAGVTNVNAPGAQLLTPPAGTPSALLPAQSAQTIGRVFLNVDFADSAVNGAIVNRTMPQLGLVLPDVILTSAPIDGDGAFFGTLVQYRGSNSPDIGDYGGIFGGTGATAVGGVVSLTQFDGEGNLLGFENEREIGVFVLSRCGFSGADAALCTDVN